MYWYDKVTYHSWSPPTSDAQLSCEQHELNIERKNIMNAMEIKLFH